MKQSLFGKRFGSIIDISEDAINNLFYGDDDYFKPKKSTKKYEAETIKPKQLEITVSEEADLSQDISVIYKQLQKKFYYSNNVEKFQKQATYIRNLEDNYNKRYESYITKLDQIYTDFSFWEFRAYITWRTKLRHKQYEKCQEEFLQLFLTELVLHIHDMTNDEILLEMITLLNLFDRKEDDIRAQIEKANCISTIKTFINDFIILNEVSFSFDEIQMKIGSNQQLFSPNISDLDRNRYDKNLLALELQSAYKFLQSPLLSSKYGYLFGGCIDYTFKKIEEYLNQYNIDLFDVLFKYTILTTKTKWLPYKNSKFFTFNSKQFFDTKTPDGKHYIKYNDKEATCSSQTIKKNILREAIGFAIKLTECRLRENLGFRTSLKANPQKVTIESPSLSYNELKRFRNVAPLFVTTEMQNIIINAVDSFYILSKLPKGVASKTYAEQQKKIESGEIDTTPINTDIDSSKFDNIREGSEYLRQVLVVEEETYEEKHSESQTTETNANYMEETQIKNDISAECSEISDEYHQLINSLTDAETQCIQIICNGQDIQNKLNLLGNENNLTAQTIIDAINEKALELIGDNLIDSADEPYIYEDYLTEIQKKIKEE